MERIAQMIFKLFQVIAEKREALNFYMKQE